MPPTPSHICSHPRRSGLGTYILESLQDYYPDVNEAPQSSRALTYPRNRTLAVGSNNTHFKSSIQWSVYRIPSSLSKLCLHSDRVLHKIWFRCIDLPVASFLVRMMTSSLRPTTVYWYLFRSRSVLCAASQRQKRDSLVFLHNTLVIE